jgi:hypothetical protein
MPANVMYDRVLKAGANNTLHEEVWEVAVKKRF